MRVLIIEDGLSSYVLPTVRSLAAAGWTVGIGGPRHSRSGKSRYLSARHLIPAAERGLAEFADVTADVVRRHGYDLVLGADDVEVLALSATRERIPAVFPYAEDRVVTRAFDKLALSKAAARVGLATPAVFAAADVPASVNFPVVVKSRLHWTPGPVASSGRLSAAVCATAEDLANAIATIRAAGGEPIVQQAVDGNLMALTLLIDHNGGIRARVQQRASSISPYLRTSVRAVTEPLDSDLVERAAELLRDVGWFGLANLQFLAPANATPHLIDFNGRIYGSVALAIRAGIDVPARWAALAMGRPDAGPSDARPGVRYQALEEDLRRAKAQHGGVMRLGGLPVDVARTLGGAIGAAHSTWSWKDPVPAVDRLASVVRRVVRRGQGNEVQTMAATR